MEDTSELYEAVNFIVYRLADGFILKHGTTTRKSFNQVARPAVEDIIEGSVGGRGVANCYVLDGVLTDRPDSPVTLDGLTLHNVPDGATVYIRHADTPSNIFNPGDAYTAEAADIDLEFTDGHYVITVRSWPARDAVFEVTL